MIDGLSFVAKRRLKFVDQPPIVIQGKMRVDAHVETADGRIVGIGRGEHTLPKYWDEVEQLRIAAECLARMKALQQAANHAFQRFNLRTGTFEVGGAR